MPKTPDEIKNGLECKKRVFADSCYDRCATCELSIPCYGTVERCADALALIQQLQDDNAQQARCIENMTDKLNAMNDEVAKLQAERDAAVEDLQMGVCCGTCEHDAIDVNEQPCATCARSTAFGNWQWRGVQKEE